MFRNAKFDTYAELDLSWNNTISNFYRFFRLLSKNKILYI